MSGKSYQSITAVRQACKDKQIQLTEEEMHLLVLPLNDSVKYEAYIWCRRYFELMGDKAPNRDNLVQLPEHLTKLDVYIDYSRQTRAMLGRDPDESILHQKTFERLWSAIFPNVKITKFKQVTAKCGPCVWIYERMRIFKTAEDLIEIRNFMDIHKVMVQTMKADYYNNRMLAMLDGYYHSYIMDGMAQGHTILPHYGNKMAVSCTCQQKIIGVKAHGFSSRLYRTLPHIASNANLCMEVLFLEIERRMKYCIENDVEFGRVLLLRIDGGPDLAAKKFYAGLELLVREGVYDRIEVARLPVGHTHEDIDAMFGTVWKALQSDVIITPQEWEEKAIAAFNAKNIKLSSYHVFGE